MNLGRFGIIFRRGRELERCVAIGEMLPVSEAAVRVLGERQKRNFSTNPITANNVARTPKVMVVAASADNF